MNTKLQNYNMSSKKFQKNEAQKKNQPRKQTNKQTNKRNKQH